MAATQVKAVTYTGSDLIDMLGTGKLTLEERNGSQLLTYEYGGEYYGDCLVISNTTTSPKIFTLTFHDVPAYISHLEINASMGTERGKSELMKIRIGENTVYDNKKKVGDFSWDGDSPYTGDVALEYDIYGGETILISSVIIGEASRKAYWSETEITAVMGEEVTLPNLYVGGSDPIIPSRLYLYVSRFTSSNEDVAFVSTSQTASSNTKNLYIVGEGEAVITAYIGADENYPTASASFHITVLPYTLQGSSETIEMEESGTLALRLSDLESTQVGRIKINGTINSSDIAALISKSGRLASVQEIDLSEALLQYDDGIYLSTTKQDMTTLSNIKYNYHLSEREETVKSGHLEYRNLTYDIYSPHLVSAFQGMTSLKKMVLPTSVNKIGENTFRDCSALLEVQTANGVEAIEDYAFYNCTSLVKHNLGSPKHVGMAAFGSADITQIDLSQATYIGGSAFWGTLLKEANLSAADTISSLAFNDCYRLINVTFGESLKVIEGGAFIGCPIDHVDFPDGLTDIGRNAFNGSMLTSITLPSTARRIDAEAFYGTPWKEAQRGKGIDGVVYLDGVAMFIDPAYDIPANTTIRFREGTTAISDYFNASIYYEKRSNITAMQLPSTLKYIGEGDGIGRDGRLEGLSSVTLPDGLEEIGNMFKGSALQSISIPASVKEIHNSAFSNCKSLVRVNYNATRATGTFIFSGCTGLDKAMIGANVEHLPDGMFSGCTSLLKVEFGESERFSIGGEAFRNCSALLSAPIPWTTDSIGQYAFLGCKTLKELYLNPNLTYIGRDALPGGIATVYNYMPVPYELVYNDSFFSGGKETTIYVLPDYYEMYLANEAWNRLNIQIMDESHQALGIRDINVGNNYTSAKDVYYDLSGRRVSKSHKGIIINNGRKMLVKQ